MMTLGDAELRDPMLPAPFVVVDRTEETADTVTLRVQPVGAAETTFDPGQFSMLYAVGVGEVPISISGDPGFAGFLEYTIRSVGAVTNALTSLRPGDHLGLRGPFGIGWPLESGFGRDLVIVAGGIGLAPLRPVVLHALAHRDRFNAVSLLYGARTPHDLLFNFELHGWRARFDIEVEVTVDRGSADWMGDVGVVTQLLNRVLFEPENTTAMVCGPEVMMRAAARQLQSHGVATADIAVSLERNMKCGIGLCGHCQLSTHLLCRDGPVVAYRLAEPWMEVAEL
jgi:NAD(P)H-flavin reductase